jgi:Tfp pilus assembly protein PilF
MPSGNFGGIAVRLIVGLVLAAMFSGTAFAQTDTVLKDTPAPMQKEVAALASPADPLATAQRELREGHPEQAAVSFRKLVSEGSGAAAAAGLVRSLVRLYDVPAANEAIKKALAEFPDSPAVHEANGEVLYRRGILWDAEVEFAKTINKWGPNAQAYLWLSRIYTAEAFHKKSRTMLERAYAIDPDDPEVKKAYSRVPASRHEEPAVVENVSKQPDQKSITEADKPDAPKPVDLTLKQDGKPEAKPEANAAAKGIVQVLRSASASHYGCQIVGSPKDVQIPLMTLLRDPTHVHGYGFDMMFNDQHARLLLDTGAGGIVINRRLAEKAGVKPLIESSIRGIGDKHGASGYIGRLESLKVGNLELRNCLVEVSETRDVMDDDGLIGSDLFQEYLVEIDFPHHTFRLSELPPRPDEAGKAEPTSGDSSEVELHDSYIAPSMKDFTRMFRVAHYLLIPTMVNQSPPRLFLLDTGAFNNAMATDAARELMHLDEAGDMHVRGLSGNVKKVYTASTATLAFSHFRQQNLDLVAFDLSRISRSAGLDVSGTLGFGMLRMLDIFIDYRDGLVNFKYDPNALR